MRLRTGDNRTASYHSTFARTAKRVLHILKSRTTPYLFRNGRILLLTVYDLNSQGLTWVLFFLNKFYSHIFCVIKWQKSSSNAFRFLWSKACELFFMFNLKNIGLWNQHVNILFEWKFEHVLFAPQKICWLLCFRGKEQTLRASAERESRLLPPF